MCRKCCDKLFVILNIIRYSFYSITLTRGHQIFSQAFENRQSIMNGVAGVKTHACLPLP